MPETTFLHDSELGRPSGDAEIDELLAEVRQRTDRNYQVVVHRHAARVILRRRVVEHMQLYLRVGGVAPWQVLGCAHDRPTIRSYLIGVINGLNEAERRS